jgi:class 3 adenylate cyclase
MMRRLSLAIGFGLFYFLTFLPLDLVNYFATGRNAFDLLWIGTNLARILCLLGCWRVLKSRWIWQQQYTRFYTAIVFLVASGSLSLFHRFYETFRGLATHHLVCDLDLFSWALLFITQATLIPVHWRLHLASQLMVLLYYFIVNPLLGFQVLPEGTVVANLLLNVFWICCICNCSVYFYEQLSAANFESNHQLRETQERSEQLLLNILPKPVAEQLKDGARTIAESFAEVTVLFADLVNFTELAEAQRPTEVVEVLNQIFSRFDQLAEHHQLEKIKTIGDAYMVVAGLPQPRADHAQAMMAMAMDMQQALAGFNQQTGHRLSLRIGIHTGPVVAGVIGLKKFAYDLWGDTVNTASRMESHGLADRIQVSAATYDYLKADYAFERRGPIPIKGKGAMTVYLLSAQAEVLAA